MHVFRAVIGVVIIIGLCYLFSADKKAIKWRVVIGGLFLQFVLAFGAIKIPFIRSFFKGIVDVFLVVINASERSAAFLFGNLATDLSYGFVFSALPVIILFSALTSLAYYYGLLQKVVYGFAWLMNKTMKLSGPESLAAAANVFIGQTEAPLVVKPYLERMTRSEIMTIMVGGLATIAGSVFGVYVSILGGDDLAAKQEFGMHLLIASVISAPAALLIAKIMVPEKKDHDLKRTLDVPKSDVGSNALDALTRGTTDGVKLAVNVAAMLFSFMAIIFLTNSLLELLGNYLTINDSIQEFSGGKYDNLSLQLFLGYLFAPLAWIIGITSDEVLYIGQLLGEKTILNEFVAYSSLGEMKRSGILSERSIIIAAYALCGFANFASVGIQIGGISSIAPKTRKDLTELGFKALVGGTLATMLTGCIAGALI
jgi:CNT family concentrative nucleoside transporter